MDSINCCLIQKHLPLSIPTARGNLNQEKNYSGQKNTLSHPQNNNTSDDPNPSAPTPNYRTHNEVYSVTSSNKKEYMHLTGRLPYFSSWLNEYFFIEYHCDENTIVIVPLKNRQSVTITKACKYLNKDLFHKSNSKNMDIG